MSKRDSVILDQYGRPFRRRRYEGAANSRRTQGWRAPATSQNEETRISLPVLRRRARQLARDNSFAKRGVGALRNDLVGRGIQPRPLGLSQEDKRLVLDVYRSWALTIECDQEGESHLPALQRAAIVGMIEGGESLVRRIIDTDSSNPVPLRLQVLEPEHLDHDKDEELANGNRVIQGVEVDSNGRRVGYHLFKEHPGDTGIRSSSSFRFLLETTVVPREDMIHLYRTDRAGQVRGVPWLAPCMIRLRDFDELLDARMVREKIAAMFGGFIRNNEMADLSEPAEGSTEEDDRIQTLEPGTWPVLKGGTEIDFANPPVVEGWREASQVTLQEIASGLDVTYEALTSDLSNVNFSSGRMGAEEMRQSVEDIQEHTVVPRLLTRIWDWFLEVAVLAKALPPRLRKVPVIWSFPAPTIVDPRIETAAMKLRIRNGVTSLAEEIRRRGEDPDKVLEEIAETNAKLDEMGIVLDSDPRNTGQPGAASSGSGDRGSFDLELQLEELVEEVLARRLGRNGAVQG